MKFFKEKGMTRSYSFTFNGRQVVVRRGVIEADTDALTKALEASPRFEKCEDPRKLEREAAKSAPISNAATALLQGKSPRPGIGIATTDTLKAIVKESGK